jgi:hypothetical protein
MQNQKLRVVCVLIVGLSIPEDKLTKIQLILITAKTDSVLMND